RSAAAERQTRRQRLVCRGQREFGSRRLTLLAAPAATTRLRRLSMPVSWERSKHEDRGVRPRQTGAGSAGQPVDFRHEEGGPSTRGCCYARQGTIARCVALKGVDRAGAAADIDPSALGVEKNVVGVPASVQLLRRCACLGVEEGELCRVA